MDAKKSGKAKKDWRSFAKRDCLKFDRADYLATKFILGIVLVGSVLLGLGKPLFDAATNAPLPVSYTTKGTGGVALPRGATHDGFVTMDLLLKDATLGEHLVQALPQFLFAAMSTAVAWMLFQLLRDTEAGEPFTRRNVRRINTIAIVVGGGVVVQLAEAIAENAITTGRLPDRAEFFFEMSFTPLPLVLMLVIALIGEVFRRGVQLREDVEGLV